MTLLRNGLYFVGNWAKMLINFFFILYKWFGERTIICIFLYNLCLKETKMVIIYLPTPGSFVLAQFQS